MNWWDHLDYWHWLVFAVALVIAEVFSPAAFFLWIGIAAALVGLALWIEPSLSWETQLTAFAVISVANILFWRAWLRRHPTPTDEPTLNRRGSQYIGRIFTLDAPIVNGVGKLRVDDTSWKIEGVDCPAQSRVRVTGVDGVVLRVECQD